MSSKQGDRDECMVCAIVGGMRGALMGLGISVPSVTAAYYLKPGFRRLTASVKTALVVTPFFLGFFLNSQLELHRCAMEQREQQRLLRP